MHSFTLPLLNYETQTPMVPCNMFCYTCLFGFDNALFSTEVVCGGVISLQGLKHHWEKIFVSHAYVQGYVEIAKTMGWNIFLIAYFARICLKENLGKKILWQKTV